MASTEPEKLSPPWEATVDLSTTQSALSSHAGFEPYQSNLQNLPHRWYPAYDQQPFQPYNYSYDLPQCTEDFPEYVTFSPGLDPRQSSPPRHERSALIERSNDVHRQISGKKRRHDSTAEMEMEPSMDAVPKEDLDLQKTEIAQRYRGYQKAVRLSTWTGIGGMWKCTVGCDWCHKNKANWLRHELTHYPQEIWICFDPDCLKRAIHSRVSFRRDLAQGHYRNNHAHRSEQASRHRDVSLGHYGHAERHKLSDIELDRLHVKIPDSMFPKSCVFKGCEQPFESWDDRSSHIERHLQSKEELCRERIVKFTAGEDMFSHASPGLKHNLIIKPDQSSRFAADKDGNDDGYIGKNFGVLTPDDFDSNLRSDRRNAANKSVAFAKTFSELDRATNHTAFISMLLREVPSNPLINNFSKEGRVWLQETLKLYALQLGKNAVQQKQYDTMLFIMQFRCELSITLQHEWAQMDNRNQDIQIPAAKQALISRAGSKHNNRTVLHSWNLQHSGSSANLMDWQFAANSTAQSWLKARFRHYKQLSIPKNDVLTDIEEAVSECLLCADYVDNETPHLPYTVLFAVELDLRKFLHSHCPRESLRSAAELRSYLTLTSDGNNVQALTCSQFLAAMWPGTGDGFLDVIIKIVENGSVSSISTGQVLDGWILEQKMMFNITGSIQTIVEFAQQLAWLGSVCQSSASEGQIQFCKPVLSALSINSAVPRIGTRRTYKGEMRFQLFQSQVLDSSADCWQELFRYPVVAQGFPIANRDEDVHGLEIRLGAMISLAHSQHIHKYDKKIFIHGFSSMFSLTEHQDGSSTWHFSENPEGQYISPLYTAQNLDDPPDTHEILPDRQFAGWCSEFQYNAGTLECSYDIEPSELLPSVDGGTLSETIVRQPKRIAEEHVWIVGDKEDGFMTPGQTYFEKITWIHKRLVVLWDTENQKGWLVNGTSALLHLVLASLKVYEESPESSSCFCPEDLKRYPEEPENAAKKVLLDENNLALPIHSHGGNIIRLKRRLEDIYSCLHLLIEIQISKIGKGSLANNALDGWDFLDVADNTHDPFDARTLSLHEDCSGWMSLLRDTYAVTLFGDNFGEIISPLNSALCDEWSVLPSKKCLLAASIKDLDSISRTYGGSKKAVPRRLSKNTTWAILADKFDKCDCSSFSGSLDHNSLIQILVPSQMFRKDSIGVKALCNGPNTGAVVFGPTNSSGWTKASGSLPRARQPVKRQRIDTDSDIESNKNEDASSPAKIQNSDQANLERPTKEEYLIAIVCALREELRAVRLLFDQTYQDPSFSKGDPQSYAFGRIHSHRIVAACLPGAYGTCNATRVTTELKRSFKGIKACLLVGIGAGVPEDKHDVRLGDVVISYPAGDHSGMIKYDFKKLMQRGDAKRLGTFQQPHEALLSAINILDTGRGKVDEPLKDYLSEIAEKDATYAYPGRQQDMLYLPDSVHKLGQDTCDSCVGLKERPDRKSEQPQIHYGLIASGDQLVKHAHRRDKLYKKYGALCIEMEAAGVANVLPCLIVRGISDYADSHKHDKWHNYASAAAASYAKLLLGKARIS